VKRPEASWIGSTWPQQGRDFDQQNFPDFTHEILPSWDFHGILIGLSWDCDGIFMGL